MALSKCTLDTLYVRSGLSQFHNLDDTREFVYEKCVYDFARAIEAEVRKQNEVHREPSVAFDDPRVQAVYEILCDDTDWPPKGTPQQHWEGWIARRIVERLF